MIIYIYFQFTIYFSENFKGLCYLWMLSSLLIIKDFSFLDFALFLCYWNQLSLYSVFNCVRLCLYVQKLERESILLIKIFNTTITNIMADLELFRIKMIQFLVVSSMIVLLRGYFLIFKTTLWQKNFICSIILIFIIRKILLNFKDGGGGGGKYKIF